MTKKSAQESSEGRDLGSAVKATGKLFLPPEITTLSKLVWLTVFMTVCPSLPFSSSPLA